MGIFIHSGSPGEQCLPSAKPVTVSASPPSALPVCLLAFCYFPSPVVRFSFSICLSSLRYFFTPPLSSHFSIPETSRKPYFITHLLLFLSRLFLFCLQLTAQRDALILTQHHVHLDGWMSIKSVTVGKSESSRESAAHFLNTSSPTFGPASSLYVKDVGVCAMLRKVEEN